MERRNFEDVLRSSGVNIEREYDRLYNMFFNSGIREKIELFFYRIPFAGTCVSLDDFDETYCFEFDEYPNNFDINYLVNFCEYCYNLAKAVSDISLSALLDQIGKVIKLIGYKRIIKSDCAIFVEASKEAIAVSEIVPTPLSYELLEYNHHSLKGNLTGKREILKAMADYIEPMEKELNSFASQLKNDLFYLFNNYNIRHNNTSPGKNHNPILDDIPQENLEQIYDDTYQSWLLAILMLDHQKRRDRIETLREKQGQ